MSVWLLRVLLDIISIKAVLMRLAGRGPGRLSELCTLVCIPCLNVRLMLPAPLFMNGEAVSHSFALPCSDLHLHWPRGQAVKSTTVLLKVLVEMEVDVEKDEGLIQMASPLSWPSHSYYRAYPPVKAVPSNHNARTEPVVSLFPAWPDQEGFASSPHNSL